MAGLNLATATATLSDDGRSYAVDIDADVVGLGNLVARGTASLKTSGTASSKALSPTNFALATHGNGTTATVRVEYAAGNVTAFVADPPVLDTYNRVPIERAHLKGVTDMVSAFIIKGGAFDQSLCERRLKVFTGLERFDAVMRFVGNDTATSERTGYQGPVILCALRYIPVSGHYTDSEVTTYLANIDRILIWYAPLGDSGYAIPYRVLMSTGAGDLSLVLTNLEVD